MLRIGQCFRSQVPCLYYLPPLASTTTLRQSTGQSGIHLVSPPSPMPPPPTPLHLPVVAVLLLLLMLLFVRRFFWADGDGYHCQCPLVISTFINKSIGSGAELNFSIKQRNIDRSIDARSEIELLI